MVIKLLGFCCACRRHGGEQQRGGILFFCNASTFKHVPVIIVSLNNCRNSCVSPGRRTLSFSQGWGILIKTFALNGKHADKNLRRKFCRIYPPPLPRPPKLSLFKTFYQFPSNLSPQQCVGPLRLWLCVARPQALREFCQRDRVQPDTDVVIKTHRNLLCHFLAVNQQAPQSPELERGEFSTWQFYS